MKMVFELAALLLLTNINLLSSFQPNNAPKIPFDESACKQGSLFGVDHRGGWTACDDLISSGRCLVYSFGLGADWSFDNALEKFGCEVHGFDPSGKNWRDGMHGAAYANINYDVQYPSSGKRFHNWGLGAVGSKTFAEGTIPQEWPGLGDPPMSSTNSDPWVMKSLVDTIESLGHWNRTISILKIDIEGSEWSALESALVSDRMWDYLKSGRVQQLLIEWHWDPNNSKKRSASRDPPKAIFLSYLPIDLQY